MKQTLVDDLRAYYTALVGISTAKRWDMALGLTAIEHGSAVTPPDKRILWFTVTDMGLMVEEELRQLLRTKGFSSWETADTDTVMCEFAKTEYYGKIVTPMDHNVPPFYQINGQRESIYQLRLRTQALFDDQWNVAPRSYIVQKMRDNGDTVHEL